jgi:hypothetical protein
MTRQAVGGAPRPPSIVGFGHAVMTRATRIPPILSAEPAVFVPSSRSPR